MAWTGTIAGCACDWKAEFGAASCDPQVAGVDRVLAVLCLDNLESKTVTVADPASPDTTNIITDITMKTGERSWTMTNLIDITAIVSGESLNENGGIDRNETIDGKGTITTQELNFVKSYLGKEVVVFYADNDDRVWAMGYDGGLKLQNWVASFGVKSGDEKSVAYQFLNNTKNSIKEVVFATGNEAFFTKLVTVAP